MAAVETSKRQIETC